MKWVLESEKVEAVLERIWDLHDNVSDAIHAISCAAHFHNALKIMRHSSPETKHDPAPGFVFRNDFARAEGDSAAMAEARSLNAIRTALENLEDQLEFFHTVQSQQLAERDAAIARLEQSRIILAMRLTNHQGKNHRVIEEALAFVGDVDDLYEMPMGQSGEGKRSSMLMQKLISSLELARTSLKLWKIGRVVGNAALFAASMLALLQLQQVALKDEASKVQQPENSAHNSSSSQLKHFDVFSSRG